MNDDYPMISLNADDLMNDNFRRRRSTCWWIRTLPRPLSFRLVKQKWDRWTRIDKFVNNGLGFKENRNQFFLLLPMLTNCLPSYPARVSLVSIAAFTGFLRNLYLLLELLLIIIFFDQTPLHLNLATSQVHPGHYLPFPTSSAASAHSTGGLIVPQPINATKVIMVMMVSGDDDNWWWSLPPSSSYF